MLESLLSLLLIYSYPLIFLVGFFGSLGFPLPATALFIASGAFVGSGYLDGYVLFLVGWSACVLGDITGYTLARHYGRDVWSSFWLDRFLPLGAIEQKYGPPLERHGFLLVFLSRFLFTAIGPSVNILAGFMKMRMRKFLLADILGEFLYTAITFGLGYSFASEWETIVSLFSSMSTLLSSIVVLFIVLFVIWKNRFRFAR